MEQTNATAPQGKGMAITGFVLAIVGLVFYVIIAPIVTVQAAMGGGYGLGIFWLLLCLAGTVMAFMGMKKLGKTGGKKGLAITGIIIGLVATIFSTLLVIGIGKIQSAGQGFSDGMQQLQEYSDSVKTANGN